MAYEGHSIIGSNNAVRDRLQEAALRQQQRDELERAMKARLESEIEQFRSDLQEQYKVLDLEERVEALQKLLEQDANGKARDAIRDKMERHRLLMMGTNMKWGHFINNFGFAGFFTQMFR